LSRSISFGQFEVRLDEHALLVGGVPASLGSRAFDVLVALLERRDRVVTKSELLDIAWPGLVVEENNLAVQISSLRKILGAPAIATVAGRGYRFAVASVEVQGLLPLQPRVAEPVRIVRRICAIACADVVGWAQALAAHADKAVTAWRTARVELIEPSIAEFSGRVIELTAENVLVEFSSAVDAIRWALDLQTRLEEWRRPAYADFRMRACIGVEDVIVDDGKLFGTWVQSARHLLTAALADQVVVTATVKQFAEKKVPARFRQLGATSHGTQPADEARLFLVEAPAADARVNDPYRSASLGNRPAVAVLPFAVDAAEADPYFGDGMTEEIITALSANRTIFVIARTSTLRYRHSAAAPSEIAAELGVRYLVIGSVRRLMRQVRISAELVRIIWADRFDGVVEDLFGFQSQIAASIAAAVDPRVKEAEIARVIGRPTDSLDAYDSVLRGLSLIHTFRDADFELAGRAFRRATELDPAYAQAHAHLAWWHNLRFGEGRSPEISDDGRAAERLSLRAVELDPRDANSLAIAGHIQSFMRKKTTVAMSLFEQALQVDPNSAMAWARSATTLAYIGQGEEALRRAANAMRLSPFDPMMFSFCTTNGIAALVAGRDDEAASWLSKAHRLNPRYRAAWRMLIAALALSGDRFEASEIAKEFLEQEPSFRVSVFGGWYPLCQPHLGRVLDGMRSGGLPD
jgi:adenylate cyclase